MNCQELLKILNDCVDNTIDRSICEEFKRHMGGCGPCKVVVDNIKKTITIYKAGQPYEVPLEFQKRLHNALQQRWEAKFLTGKSQ